MQSIRWLICLIVLSGLPWQSPLAVEPPFRINSDSHLLRASEAMTPLNVSWILDPEGRALDINDVRFDGSEPPENSGWRRVDRSPPYINRIEETFWFRLSVEWDEIPSGSRLLSVEWYHFKFFDVFVCADTCRQIEDASETGPERFGRTIPLLFELDNREGQTFDIYIRAHSLAKLAIPLKLWQEGAFQSFEHFLVLLLGMYLGILAVMALYNLVLSYMLRDASYLIYVSYVIGVILFGLSLNGIGRAFVWGDHDWFNGDLIPLVSSAMFGLALAFFYTTLRVHQWPGGLRPFTQGLLWIWGALVLGHLTPLSDPITHIEDMAIPVTVVTIFTLGLTAWRRGNPTGLYLTIGWTIMMLSTLVVMAGFAGLVQVEPWMIWFQDFGLAIETVLFSFTLAERINRERREKAKAQELSLQYHQEASEARQLALEVEREAKSQLESQVERRTRELRTALSRLESVNIQLDARSKMDGLTGLANRAYFDEVFAAVFADCRKSGKSLSVIMGDIDHFKRLNDTLGHAAGDSCLMMVSSIWQDMLSEYSAVVARYGGEEFIAVLPQVDTEWAAELAELLRSVIEERPCYINGEPQYMTISLGVWSGRALPELGKDLLKAVDEALYCAKHKGRNRVCLVEPGSESCTLV